MFPLAALVCGTLFGVGLAMSGMTDTAKVIGFLDLFGNWDFDLAFVMGGAILVTALGFPLVTKRPKPLFAESFEIPANKQIDPRLIIGGILFGVGWGLGGFCPGPAFTAVPLMSDGIIAFFPALLIGMWAGKMAPGLTAARA